MKKARGFSASDFAAIGWYAAERGLKPALSIYPIATFSNGETHDLDNLKGKYREDQKARRLAEKRKADDKKMLTLRPGV